LCGEFRANEAEWALTCFFYRKFLSYVYAFYSKTYIVYIQIF